MKVLITGSAGFIGSALALRLLERGDEVVGIDNLNDYYDVDLKKARLERNSAFDGYLDERRDIEDGPEVRRIFDQHRPERVVNLAAQAGVRYSLENPGLRAHQPGGVRPHPRGLPPHGCATSSIRLQQFGIRRQHRDALLGPRQRGPSA